MSADPGEVRDGLGTLGEVQDGSWDLIGGLAWVGGLSARSGLVGGPSGSFGTGRGTLGEVREG